MAIQWSDEGDNYWRGMVEGKVWSDDSYLVRLNCEGVWATEWYYIYGEDGYYDYGEAYLHPNGPYDDLAGYNTFEEAIARCEEHHKAREV